MTPLNSIQGQDTAKKILLASINKDRLASTYLFYGKDGCGKWSLAVAMAALINCENPVRDENKEIVDACGECRNCRQILNLNFPEMLFALPIPPHKNEDEAIEQMQAVLNAKREEPYKLITSTRQLTISVDTARSIKRKIAIKPLEDIKRIILFYQMERMLAASADSLLKLIEEPPPETIIILTAQDTENLLPTLQSRSQKIRFRLISEPDIVKYLMDKYEVPAKSAENFARLSGGSIGQAVDLALDKDQSSSRQVSFLMFKAIFQKDNPSAVAVINEFVNPNNRGEFERILLNWQSFLSDLIIIKFGQNSQGVINTDLFVELENLANSLIDAENMKRMTDLIKDLLVSLRRNVHIRPAVSALILNLRKYINQSA